jgi:aquaglyceroporin related protein
MADLQQSSSEEKLNKADQMDKDRALHQAGTGSSEIDETIAPLPTSEALQTTTSMTPQKTSSTLQSARGKLGLHPVAPVVDAHDTAEHSDLLWPKIRLSLKEPFAEFWGTFFLVLFGDGSVAQVLLSTNQKTAPGGDGFGDYQSINWGWGLGVMLGIYIAGDSGAYLKYVLK